MHRTTAVVYAPTPKAILNVCAQKGISLQPLLKILEIDRLNEAKDFSKVPIEAVVRLWEESLQLSKDPALPAAVAKSIPLGGFKGIDFLFLSSPNILTGLERMAENFALLNTAFRFTTEKFKNQLVVTLDSAIYADYLIAPYVDFIFAALLNRLHHYGSGIAAKAILLDRKTESAIPQQLSHRFITNENQNAIIFDISEIERGWPSYDPELFDLLSEYCRNLRLRRQNPSEAFKAQVAFIIKHSIVRRQFSIESVSEQLNISPRTLQRKLLVCGTSYTEIVDQVRYRMLMAHLKEEKLSQSFITDVLAFEEASSFYKAFRRWTGRNISEFKQVSKE